MPEVKAAFLLAINDKYLLAPAIRSRTLELDFAPKMGEDEDMLIRIGHAM